MTVQKLQNLDNIVKLTGTIDRLIPSDKGFHHYAFIKYDGKKLVFLHQRNLADSWDVLIEMVKKGVVKIEFDTEMTDKGLKAIHARILSE